MRKMLRKITLLCQQQADAIIHALLACSVYRFCRDRTATCYLHVHIVIKSNCNPVDLVREQFDPGKVSSHSVGGKTSNAAFRGGAAGQISNEMALSVKTDATAVKLAAVIDCALVPVQNKPAFNGTQTADAFPAVARNHADFGNALSAGTTPNTHTPNTYSVTRSHRNYSRTRYATHPFRRRISHQSLKPLDECTKQATTICYSTRNAGSTCCHSGIRLDTTRQRDAGKGGRTAHAPHNTQGAIFNAPAFTVLYDVTSEIRPCIAGPL
jgi:hypothetical protein